MAPISGGVPSRLIAAVMRIIWRTARTSVVSPSVSAGAQPGHSESVWRHPGSARARSRVSSKPIILFSKPILFLTNPCPYPYFPHPRITHCGKLCTATRPALSSCPISLFDLHMAPCLRDDLLTVIEKRRRKGANLEARRAELEGLLPRRFYSTAFRQPWFDWLEQPKGAPVAVSGLLARCAAAEPG